MNHSLRYLLTGILAFGLLLETDSAFAKKKRKSREKPKATVSSSISCKDPKGASACMVCNCFNEAGNQDYEGQVAVGKVVMTRVGLSDYPDSVCGVVKQKDQFSWYNKKSTRQSVPKKHSCFKAAKESLKFRGYFADHYYASYIRKPRWAKKMKSVSKIGTHQFYAAASSRTSDKGDQAEASLGVASMLISIPSLQGLVDLRGNI